MSRLYPQSPILAVSTAVFRDGKVLLGLRKNPPAARMFSLPGGVVELGEKIEDAALRELFEETGVRAQIIGMAGHVQIIDVDDAKKVRRHFVVVTFVALWNEGEGVPSDETPELAWVDPLQLGERPVTANLPQILANAAGIVAAHKQTQAARPRLH